MTIRFLVLNLNEHARASKPNTVQLEPDNWDDFSFKTLFKVVYQDAEGKRQDLGSTKIGYRGQSTGWTRETIPRSFERLPDGWFSLGQDVDFYENAFKNLKPADREQILAGLCDVVANDAILKIAQDENVFSTSMMRYVGRSVLLGQYRRALNGEPVLSDFNFIYQEDGGPKRAPVKLRFQVTAESRPPTNIHAIIGRNGVGKTTLLNNMVKSLLPTNDPSEPEGKFTLPQQIFGPSAMPQDYFSSVVSVSFSVFDPFVPPADQPDPSLGLRYFYIGMKKARATQDQAPTSQLKEESDLIKDFLSSFDACLRQDAKKRRWQQAIAQLCSDDNFAEMNLGELLDLPLEPALASARSKLERMSSGHKIVLLTITSLVNTVEEKTLVLLDEPESHLHPPLLSAFTRTLSDLLYSRNGVAIVATHSPVVVQEVPKSCVWILNRSRLDGRSDRPERESFGENVGALTRDIFGLEVSKSGFHQMIQSSVAEGGDFDEIMRDYSNKLGVEAQTILMSLIYARDKDGTARS